MTNPTGSEPTDSFEYPRNPIDIGDPQAWIDLYTEQARLDQELVSAMAVGQTAMQSMEEMSLGLTLETSFAEETSDPSGVMALADNATDVFGQAMQAQQAAFDAHAKVGAIYGESGFREWELGTELEHVTPAEYVTRAIGQPHDAITKRYRQVRAEIEIFRQLTGETRPDVTLGIGLPEQWAQSRLAGFVFNIHRIQMAQIMLSPEPKVTASDFDKSAVIDRVGLPPSLDGLDTETILKSVEDGSWLKEAVTVCAEIEPLELGLSIDRR